VSRSAHAGFVLDALEQAIHDRKPVSGGGLVSIEMMPEDGIIAVYDVGDDYLPAFTDYGIENLRELVRIYKDEAQRQTADQPEND
jgi:hypothetical protein